MLCCSIFGAGHASQSPAAKESPSGRRKGSESKKSPVHESKTRRAHKVKASWTFFLMLLSLHVLWTSSMHMFIRPEQNFDKV